MTSYVVIRPVDPNQPMHGKNCEVIIGGKPVEYVGKVTFEVEAGRMSSLTITLVAPPVEIRGAFDDITFTAGHSETDPATGKEPF